MKTAYLASSLCVITSIAGTAFSTADPVINGHFDVPNLSCPLGPCTFYGFCGVGIHQFRTDCVQNNAFGWTSQNTQSNFVYMVKSHALMEGIDVFSPSLDWDQFFYLQHHAPSLPPVKLFQGNMLGHGYAESFYSYRFYHRGVGGSSTIRFDVVSRDSGQICHSHVVTTSDDAWVQYSGEFHRPNINGNGYDLRFQTVSENGASLLDEIFVNQIDPPPTSCPDLTGNQVVDSVDLAIVLSAWGSAGGEFGADINQDGIVNAADLAILLSGWGVCYQ